MKLKHLAAIAFSIALTFTSFAQSDSLYLSSSYGFSEADVVDSTLMYHSIDVTVHNIDTLNWNTIMIEVKDSVTNQVVARTLVNRNNPNSDFSTTNNSVSSIVAVLPKSVYYIYAKVKHIGGAESETIETTLSDD